MKTQVHMFLIIHNQPTYCDIGCIARNTYTYIIVVYVLYIMSNISYANDISKQALCIYVSFLSWSLFTILAGRCHIANSQKVWYVAGHAFWDTLTPPLPAGNGRGSSLQCPWVVTFSLSAPPQIYWNDWGCWAGHFINTSPLDYCDHQPWAASR